jgi:hypothetical protein
VTNQRVRTEHLLLWFEQYHRQWILGFFSDSEERVDKFRSTAIHGALARKAQAFNQLQWEMGGNRRIDYSEFWTSNHDDILNVAIATSESLGLEVEQREPLLSDC